MSHAATGALLVTPVLVWLRRRRRCLQAYSGLRMLEFVLANNTVGSDPILTKAKQDVDTLITGSPLAAHMAVGNNLTILIKQRMHLQA